jgi:DNA-binding response OmpR family regulator
VVDAHTVDNFVSNLRKKLEWNSASRFEIRSVRGVGYRLDLHG